MSYNCTFHTVHNLSGPVLSRKTISYYFCFLLDVCAFSSGWFPILYQSFNDILLVLHNPAKQPSNKGEESCYQRRNETGGQVIQFYLQPCTPLKQFVDGTLMWVSAWTFKVSLAHSPSFLSVLYKYGHKYQTKGRETIDQSISFTLLY